MFESLESQRFLIVGAGSGIGESVARKLVGLGAQCVASGRSIEKLDSLSRSIAKKTVLQPGQLTVQSCDIAKPEECERLFAHSMREMGRVDIVINCAGVHAPRRAFSDLTTEDVEQLMSVNSAGVFNLLHHFVPSATEQTGGHFIQVSSAAADRPSVLAGCGYTASKYAIEGMIKTISQELMSTPETAGVRVSMVSPGPVDTPLVDTRPVPATAADRAKMLDPETVANCILFTALMGDDCYIEKMVLLPTGKARA